MGDYFAKNESEKKGNKESHLVESKSNASSKAPSVRRDRRGEIKEEQ